MKSFSFVDRSNEQQKDDFLEEIKLMKEVGQHKNIVSMLGCVTRGDTLCLVVEFMPYGDLLHYLRGRRSKVLFLCQPLKFLYAIDNGYELESCLF